MKVIPIDAVSDTARRASAAPLPRRRILCTGVIPARNTPRPSVRLVARIDDAVLRITHLPPDGPRAA